MANENTYTVTGMSCGHCAAAVTAKVSEIVGVTDVQVDVDSGTLTFASDSPVSRDQVQEAVDEAGYALA